MTPLVVDYNPRLPNISRIIQENIHLLTSSKTTKDIFPPKSIIPAFRRPKNLKQLLAPSKLKPEIAEGRCPGYSENINRGCFKCNKNRCDLCKNFLTESNHFRSCKTGRIFPIRQHLTCTSKNVVYLTTCELCQLQYVGSTPTEFKVRFRNHKSSIGTNKRTCELASHFNKLPHNLSDISFTCIESVVNPSDLHIVDDLLPTREAYWSAQLFALQPFGLNKMQEFRSKNRIHYDSVT